ncbi:2-thiouracil desulfurase family protein [Serratia fonticola]|uniref:DUF523 domain-containing protein n=1 Tax=Serratia fonticola TaxID=47917 RepID=UPI0003AC9165|nr:Purine nucleoside phosphorylase [Serratia fonticola AU-P3(3)]
MPPKILLSACLAGFNVRYNASSKTVIDTTLQQWQKEGRLVVCCPVAASPLSCYANMASKYFPSTSSTR